LRAGMNSIEHLRGYDFDGMSEEELAVDGGRSAERFISLDKMSDERMNELIQQTAAANTWNIPTLAIVRFLYDGDGRAALAEQPRFRRTHPSTQQSVRGATVLDEMFSPESRAALREVQPRQLELIRKLNAAGAGVLVGTDSIVPAYVPGFTVIDEIKMLAASGMSVFDVLHSTTAGAAAYFGIDTQRGTLSVGMQASLILLGGNPLEDLDHLWSLRGVLHQDRWLSMTDMEAMLDEQIMNTTWQPPEAPQ